MMGKIAQTLRREILLQVKQKVVEISDVKEMKELAKKMRPEDGLEEFEQQHRAKEIDSLYYPYLYGIKFIAGCMYGMLRTEEMEDFKKALESQEKLYRPGDSKGGPVTESYYRIWELADFHFGCDRETLSSMFLELRDILKISYEEREIVKNISNSRMGIYEVCEIKGEKFLLKELVSDKNFWCLGLDGIEGRVGQLWYIRVFPPFDPDGHAITLSAPYVLLSSKEEWNSFFERKGVDKKNLHDFMKFGPSVDYWNEFIFFGFACVAGDTIFLNGLPDLSHSLPCSKEFSEKEKLYMAFDRVLSQRDKEKIIEHNMQQSNETDAPKDKKQEASEVFLEYSMPLLKKIFDDGETDLKIIANALKVPWAVWNLSLLNQGIAEYPKEMKENYDNKWIKLFEERKRNDFDDYKYFMGDFKLISQKNGDFILKMETRELPN